MFGRQNDLYHVKTRVIIICFVTFLCIVEHGDNSMAEPETDGHFQIYVIADRLIDILPYNYENPAWRKLLETPPNGTVILTDKDIETYNWRDQEIILSTYASKRLSGIKLIEKLFIVYLNKKQLYGGAFIELGSARAINYPVIYIDKKPSQVVFQLRPIHSILQNYRQLDTKIKGRIELEDIKRHFETLGKMKTNLTEQDVLKIALSVLKKTYPESFDNCAPYHAKFENGNWHVFGTLPKNWRGGTPEAVVQDKDGTILKITHTQ